MLGKILGKDKQNEPQAQPQDRQQQSQPYGQQQRPPANNPAVFNPSGGHSNPAMGVVNNALGLYQHPLPPQRWRTTDCQCEGFESCTEDWLCALFMPPAAGALARANVDGTNCCYALITSPPALNYNVVRRRYNIVGDDGEDAIYSTFCMPCAMRKALTESKLQGRIRNWGQYKWEAGSQDSARWTTELCSCSPRLFCYALLLPFCLAASTREIFDNSSCCFNVFCSSPCAVVSMVRSGYGIEGNEGIDCVTTLFLWPCALERAYNEAMIVWLKALAAKAKAMCNCGCC